MGGQPLPDGRGSAGCCKGAESGFTLLEVMVASTIMAVAVVGMISGISGSLRNASRLTEYDRVMLAARARMDALVNEPRLPRMAVIEGELDPAALGGARGGWRARVTPFESPPAAGPQTQMLERVELEIWWTAGSQRRSFTLEAFRRVPSI